MMEVEWQHCWTTRQEDTLSVGNEQVWVWVAILSTSTLECHFVHTDLGLKSKTSDHTRLGITMQGNLALLLNS